MKRIFLLAFSISLLSIAILAQTPSPSVATTPGPSVNQGAASVSPSPSPESKGPATLPWVVEMFASGVMLVAVAGVLAVVLRSRNEEGTLSVNPRHIQFASVCLIVPTILILGLEKVLTSETTATLIGGLAGYLLSNLGKYEPQKKDPKKDGSGKSNEDKGGDNTEKKG